MLGGSFEVANFGASSRTLLRGEKKSSWASCGFYLNPNGKSKYEVFNPVRMAAIAPWKMWHQGRRTATLIGHLAQDIVVVMLGTNDSKLQHYRNRLPLGNDLGAFIAEFRELNSLVRIFICTPTPIARDDPLRQDRYKPGQEPGVATEIITGADPWRLREGIVPVLKKVAAEQVICRCLAIFLYLM